MQTKSNHTESGLAQIGNILSRIIGVFLIYFILFSWKKKKTQTIVLNKVKPCKILHIKHFFCLNLYYEQKFQSTININ